MKVLQVLILTGLLFSCTENPFSRPAEISSRQAVTGRVVSAATGLPMIAYVWFEGTNTGHFTDSQGKFVLTLPERSSQPPGGLTGVFPLHVFAGNFQPLTRRIVVRNGEFVYSQPPVNEQGNIDPDIFLQQLFEISTTVTPATFTRDYEGIWQVEISVHTLLDSLHLNTIESKPWEPGAVIIQRVDTSAVAPQLFTLAPFHTVTRTLSADTATWTGRKMLLPGDFALGEYRAVPLFWIEQELPDAVFETIGVNFDSLDTGYLKLPFVRSGGDFVVRNPK